MWAGDIDESEQPSNRGREGEELRSFLLLSERKRGKSYRENAKIRIACGVSRYRQLPNDTVSSHSASFTHALATTRTPTHVYLHSLRPIYHISISSRDRTHLTIVYSTLWCVERASIIHQHNLANSTSTKCWEPCGADCRWLARLRCRPASHARSCSRHRELPRP